MHTKQKVSYPNLLSLLQVLHILYFLSINTHADALTDVLQRVASLIHSTNRACLQGIRQPTIVSMCVTSMNKRVLLELTR